MSPGWTRSLTAAALVVTLGLASILLTQLLKEPPRGGHEHVSAPLFPDGEATDEPPPGDAQAARAPAPAPASSRESAPPADPDAAPPAQERGLHGRVLERGTGAPVEGARVLLVGPGDRIAAEATSDAAGRFALGGERYPGRWVRLLAPEGWGAPTGELQPSPEQWWGREELVLELERRPSARVRGILRDPQGLGVPGARLVFTAVGSRDEYGSWSAFAHTEEDGRFATNGALPPGELVLEVRDDYSSHRLAWDRVLHELGVELELLAEVGPTFRLDAGPEVALAPGAWQARVVERAEGRGERVWGWNAVRPGPHPWLRYHRVMHEPGPEWVPHLELERNDHRARGEGPLATTVGLHPGLVRVELRELARLRVQAVDAGGRPEQDVAYVLAPRPGGRLLPERSEWLEERADHEGRLDLEGLEPGPWRLTVKPLHREVRTLELELPPGLTDLGTLGFPALQPAGDLAGLLIGREGLPDPSAVLLLRSVGPGHTRRWQAVGPHPDWGERRRVRGGRTPFAFENLPPGEYELELFPRDLWAYEPPSLGAAVPAAELRFQRRDGGTPRPFGFRPYDAETDAPVPYFRVRLAVAGRWRLESEWERHGEAMDAMGQGLELRWLLSADGYRPATGGLEAFRPVPGGDLLLADVPLERGFGGALVVLDGGALAANPGWGHERELERAHAPPLPGVEVVADGVSAGVSDEHGLVRLSLPRLAERLELRRPGWRFLDAENFRDGRVQDAQEDAVVWLQPD